MQDLSELYNIIEARKTADPAQSYTARLFAAGRPVIARKVGEEAVEALIEGLGSDKAALVRESADLLYHLLVLWVAAGVRPEEVAAELRFRHQPASEQ